MDKEEHHGSLFWVITRTSEMKEVRLELDNITWSQNIKMNLHAPKKRKTEVIEREPSEPPSFPILLIKKAIVKHTKLCVYLPKQTTGKAKPKEAVCALWSLAHRAGPWRLEVLGAWKRTWGACSLYA